MRISHNEIISLLVQLGVMLMAARLFAEIARKLRQPAVVGEIYGHFVGANHCWEQFHLELFQKVFHLGQSSLVLDGFVQVAVVMLLFIAGLEVDLHIVYQQGRQALFTSFFGLVIPFTQGLAFHAYLLNSYLSRLMQNATSTSIVMGISMAITALPVIVRILHGLEHVQVENGHVGDLIGHDKIWWAGWCFRWCSPCRPHGWNGIGSIRFGSRLGSHCWLDVGRYIINKTLPWVNKRIGLYWGVLSISLASCFWLRFTEYIGIHAIFGAFIMGVALGDSEHLAERAKEIIHQFINNIFAPLFFVAIGLKVNFISNFDGWPTHYHYSHRLSGKIVGAGLGTRLGGFNWRESIAVGFGMNARGAIEDRIGFGGIGIWIDQRNNFVSTRYHGIGYQYEQRPLMKWCWRSIKHKMGVFSKRWTHLPRCRNRCPVYQQHGIVCVSHGKAGYWQNHF